MKVEEWLAAVPPPYPDDSAGEINDVTNGKTDGGSKANKDFYGTVVELYCLGILPKNDEWDFANTFIEMSEYLSESKKKVSVTLNPSNIRRIMPNWKTFKPLEERRRQFRLLNLQSPQPNQSNPLQTFIPTPRDPHPQRTKISWTSHPLQPKLPSPRRTSLMSRRRAPRDGHYRH